MRVAILCPYSLSIPGGVQGQVLGLADRLRSLGHEATVLAPVDERLGSKTEPAFLTETGGVVSLGHSLSLRANGSVAPVALGPTASFRALRTLRAGRFDVLHIHEPFALGASYACLLASKQALVGTFHRSGGSVFYSVLAPVTRKLAGRLQVRCAVSPQARSTAAKALGGTYELIGNGVDVERFKDAEPFPTDAPTVMFVGRHEKRKGLAVLLDAFTRLDDPRAVCWVAGLGPETADLQLRFPESERIQWLGRIDDTELATRLRGSQVACFPSLAGESFGVVLLEAMAARCAIVASDLDGYRSVAEGFAQLVEPGNPESLASALASALSDAATEVGWCSHATLDAGATHADIYSLDVMARRYLEVYEEALESKRV